MLIENNKKLKENHRGIEFNKKEFQTFETDLSEKLDVANASFNKITKELSDQKNTIEELNTIIQKQSQIIQWYKDTYENRNIVGILKEKFMSRLKKNKL